MDPQTRRDLLRFSARAALLSLPLVLYAGAIVAIDPFDRFGVSHVVPAAAKEQVASTLNEALWQVIRFDRPIGENILIGGSKMARINAAIVQRVTGLSYENLSIGGAPLIEMVEMFWYAQKRAHLKRVAFGLSLETLNRFNQRNRVAAAITTAKNPLLYLTNRDVLASARNLVAATFLGGSLATGKPDVSAEEFWRTEVRDWAQRQFGMFAFDEGAFARFEEVARYCKAHGIELKILILPSHADIHAKIRAMGLEDEWRRAAVRFAAVADTYDFDVDDEVTAKRQSFTDPVHCTPEVAEQIVRRAWAPSPR
jgi:hypothetical protein